MAINFTGEYNDDFTFKPQPWTPFQDQEVMKRLAAMTPEEIVKHPNPDFHITIMDSVGAYEIADMFAEIKASDDFDRKFTFICGNPNPDTYIPVAELINNHNVNCRNIFPFTMDEWADDQGHIAPLTYRSGFSYSFMKYFYMRIREDLRPPIENITMPNNENIKYYSDLIDECGEGGCDVLYAGPGWAGHIAFIDPCPELIPGYCEGGEYILKSLDDPYFQQKAQVLTLHPLTIAQNSLHGVFGCSGAVGMVPPKAATIGPRDVLHAKKRYENHALATMGTFSSWQRMTSRLICHGPVTPYVPGSMFQLMETHVHISPNIAKPIEVLETVGY